MKKSVYEQGPIPELLVLGESKQPSEPAYTLCLLPLPSRDFFLLLSDKEKKYSYITAKSAKNLLKKGYFQKTRYGDAWLQAKIRSQWGGVIKSGGRFQPVS